GETVRQFRNDVCSCGCNQKQIGVICELDMTRPPIFFLVEETCHHTSKLGDYFQYAIDHAVSLPRQKSALLPIVGKDVDGERVSIFNERTHPKFPLLGLVFKN